MRYVASVVLGMLGIAIWMSPTGHVGSTGVHVGDWKYLVAAVLLGLALWTGLRTQAAIRSRARMPEANGGKIQMGSPVATTLACVLVLPFAGFQYLVWRSGRGIFHQLAGEQGVLLIVVLAIIGIAILSAVFSSE